jgi:hypothetical protein
VDVQPALVTIRQDIVATEIVRVDIMVRHMAIEIVCMAIEVALVAVEIILVAVEIVRGVSHERSWQPH